MNSLTIVMYHYVRDLQRSRFPNIKGLDTESFLEQILFLRNHYNFVTSEDVVSCLQSGVSLPPHAVLLTFDDAYIDHYTEVFPILDRLHIQGSFYVPTKAIFEREVLDVNKIHFILAAEPDTAIVLKAIQNQIRDLQGRAKFEDWDTYRSVYGTKTRLDSAEVAFVKRLLQFGLPEEIRSSIVNTLFERFIDMDEQAFSREVYMSQAQLETMKRHGMHIGCHGHNHYWWNKLSLDEIKVELDTSLKLLADSQLLPKYWSACYPYGSVDQQAVGQLASHGCSYAVTTEVAVARLDSVNRFMLPRLDTNDLPKSRLSKPNTWYVP